MQGIRKMEKGFKITSIKAFIAEDEDGTEGVCAHSINGQWMPFVCADDARVESLKPIVKEIARTFNKKIKLIKFSVREDLEEF